MATMLPTTTAKKLFRPMPGAIAKGLLAINAMQNVPMAEAIQVARNTPFHSSSPAAPKPGAFSAASERVAPSAPKVAPVEDPNDTGSYVGTLTVGETAIVTSGSYQRFFTDSKGNTYHHILNPSSGYPVTNTLESVTIICSDGTLADCLSTAMFVLGETRAINYWRTYGGFEMILVTKEDKIICTKGLMEKFTLTNENYGLKFVE